MNTKVTDFSNIPIKGGNIAPQPERETSLAIESAPASQGGTILDRLQKTHAAILEAAAGTIVFSPAWVSLGDVPIFTKGTLNIIQGKSGVHKSRLAEYIAGLLLSHGKGDVLGFTKHHIGTGYCVSYVDTERNTQEDFPAAVQRIRERAGFERTAQTKNFYPASIKQFDRGERLDAVRAWIEHVRSDMLRRGVSDWNLFVVLDVVTDCVRSFNHDADSLALFDYLGNLCEQFGVAFLLVLHENPGSEKARGHTGTEGMNKANTQLQIGYEKGRDGEDTDLIKLRFLKTRNSARPKPIYLQYSQSERGLVLADDEAVNEVMAERMRKAEPELLREYIERFFDERTEAEQSDLISGITAEFRCHVNTAKDRVKEIVLSGNGMTTAAGKPARLISEKKGRNTVYRIEPKEEDAGAKNDSDVIPW